ncbi:uncharacterized protein EI90DRAFT_3008851 [Cantharellus anzutake]|uniref:uncharacterized protein n=1 Tax=Cantharellus anzutake TaxID=1750568 RepID=UPI0019041C55|nr:uncharacterized protein EI90DRAFT_3008851 [Cantharellus anzutake]KAF8308656.1 hypothetical protein EI90DRAFT_3008851 [Cantharellus anzutake]
MCDDQAQTLPRPKRFDRGKICAKCNSVTGNLVVRHSVYCKACLVSTVSLKVRRDLDRALEGFTSGSGRGNVLIGYSGGAGSSMLADIVRREYIDTSLSLVQPMKRQGSKKPPSWRSSVWNNAYIAYVDLSAALGGKAGLSSIMEIAKHYPQYTLVSLHVQDAFDPAWWHRVTGQELSALLHPRFEDETILGWDSVPFPTPDAALKAFLDALPSSSSTVMALRHLLRVLLLYTAKSLACSHVLLGDSIISLSTSLLSSIASGSGHVLRHEQTEQWGDIHILRPIAGLTTKECAAWVHWNRIPLLHGIHGLNGDSSIQKLSADFLHDLERDFPSTLFTIVKTCNKVESLSIPLSPCIFCLRPRPAGMGTWRSHTAIRSRKQCILVPEEGDLNLCPACQRAMLGLGQRGDVAIDWIPFPVWVNFNQSYL